MLTIDTAVQRITDLRRGGTRARRIPFRKRNASGAFSIGLLAGAGLTVAGFHQVNHTQPDLVLAITLYPVTAPAGQIAVLTVAVAVLIGFLLWSKRAASAGEMGRYFSVSRVLSTTRSYTQYVPPQVHKWKQARETTLNL